eukprot:TRINITY_DN17_c0_g1_i1.p1 TRINITY_DN17_c0_g1~~TRINITY_DN17_c0_g1_i1.p1  ORF type:complete len:293 (+),score=46.41 TRINITY_DN17_c0_g1_i1:62-940(+)
MSEKGQFYRLDEDQTIWVRKNDACSDPISVQHPLIIFVHTTSSSSSAFEHQMNSTFLNAKYRMMAIDLPGHGKSHKASKPDVYTIQGYARVLNSFLTVTDVKDAVVVGWGTGGRVLLEAYDLIKDRLRGLVVFGTPLIRDANDLPKALNQENPAIQYLWKEKVTYEEALEATNAFFEKGLQVPVTFLDDFLNADGVARALYAKSLAESRFKNELYVFRNIDKPIAFIHGANDSIVQPSYLQKHKLDNNIPSSLWRGEFIILPDAGHAVQWESPNEFNDTLDRFVRDIYTMQS